MALCMSNGSFLGRCVLSICLIRIDLSLGYEACTRSLSGHEQCMSMLVAQSRLRCHPTARDSSRSGVDRRSVLLQDVIFDCASAQVAF